MDLDKQMLIHVELALIKLGQVRLEKIETGVNQIRPDFHCILHYKEKEPTCHPPPIGTSSPISDDDAEVEVGEEESWDEAEDECQNPGINPVDER